MNKCNVRKHKTYDGVLKVAVSKIDGTKLYDIENRGGFLTSHIREKLGIEIPSLYFRKKYFKENGKQWWEQWFDITEEELPITKKCPYCDWETYDVKNKTGAMEVHIRKEHGKNVKDVLVEFPDYNEYFFKEKERKKRDDDFKSQENYVICPICNEKFYKLTLSHMKKVHGITLEEAKEKYPNIKVTSNLMVKQSIEACKYGNTFVSKNRFISKIKLKIREMLDKYHIEYESNRQMLIGKELDIYIPSKNIAIEVDGLKWHTEWFGKKNHKYHLDKTLLCNKNGVGLIHVFEDEIINNEALVLNKIRHILNIHDEKDRKIYGRKCFIKQIYKNDAKQFLDKNHIQGFVSSSIYLGAFFDDELIAVMSFKNGNIKNKGWELTRFATKNNTICSGVGGKLFKYFINMEQPSMVYSFADRRWTIDINNNLYTKLNFVIDKITPPDYKYYNENTDRYKRIHKMTFNKQTLHRKYGFPLTMTEKEMAIELGYDRIWDCGLVKYIWKKHE